MIQVGAEPGGSAQVIVPATALPLASGTEPNAPVDEETDPPEPPAEQAARPRAAATATEAHSVRAGGRRRLDVSGRGMAVTFLGTNLIGRRRCHRSWLLSRLSHAYEWSCGDLGRILSQVAGDVKTRRARRARLSRSAGASTGMCRSPVVLARVLTARHKGARHGLGGQE